MADKKISIIDVAKIAGVSTATVSRVLNGNGGYSKETEIKVLETIKQSGFRPNVSAISLRTNRSHSIGVIVPDITNEFFAKIVHELDLFCLKHKYVLLICDSNEDYELEDMHINNLLEKNVDGIVYISGQDEIKNIGKVKNVPVVYIDRSPRNAEVLIHSDNEDGGYLATAELIKKGCRRILLLCDLRYGSTIRRRRDGYLRALKEGGIPYQEDLEVSTYPDYTNASRVLRELIQAKGCFFDGIFTTNDMMALGSIHVLSEAGYRVPEDVKVVGFDNISLSKFCSPPITTIAQDTRRMALCAGEAILELIKTGTAGEMRTVIPVALEVRKSTS